MLTFTRSAAAALAGILCLLLAPAAGSAQEAPDEVAATMVVLDASGSMTGADPAGGTKMEAAKRAVHALVETVPDGAPVGLAAYGTGTGNSDAEREPGCRDVTVLREPAPVDRAAFTASVDALVPRGYTPIGRSLQVAAEHLPAEGPRSIVLVSDGEDTCAPPEPCEVARTLAGQGVDLVVHAVGFGVDDAARAQLTCIAQTTGGTYTDAPDAEALQRVLPRVAASAMRNYEPAGTPITGTPSYDGAPLAAPGQHLDTLGQKEKRYYAVDVPQGATAYFSATVSFPRLRGISPTEDMNTLQLRTYGADGQDCYEFVSELITDSSDGGTLTVATTWTGATEAETGSTSGDRCKGGDRYFFALEWDTVSLGVPERLPVELLVAVEPAAADTGPVAVLPPAAFAEPAGPRHPVVGGGSFNTAGTLGGSGTYTDTLRRSEFVFYRVRLDWGQGLAYRVHFGETPGRGSENISPIGTTVYTPVRQRIDADFTAYTGNASVLPTSKPAVTTVPVRYNNRTADVVATRTQSIAGWYYIAVELGAAEDPTPVPIRLEVTVTGTPEAGPGYASGTQATSGGGGVPAPAGAQQQAPAVVDGSDATTTSFSPVGRVFAGAGIAVAAGLLGAAVLLARRRWT
ncbi:vWA domain-containing protein [Pseudonocardia nigra]|uniref:vWA domain-containing protein n=1 Tax=Pseudonocardia nigra TaxID=1921578 RepID=UPI0027E2CDF4|nr:VWA domain-containing protein [Pseudonocardia nigra]